MKKELRQTVLNQMKKLSGKEKEQADSWLTQRLLSLAAYQKAQVMATYLSMPHEVSTASFIKQAQLDGKRVLVPKTYGQGWMIFVDASFRLPDTSPIVRTAPKRSTDASAWICVFAVGRDRKSTRLTPVTVSSRMPSSA